MNHPGLYDDYSKLSDPELCEIMAAREECGSKANIARLVYEERMMQRQHKLDRSLIQEQVKWMKFAIMIGFLGVILGAIITAML